MLKPGRFLATGLRCLPVPALLQKGAKLLAVVFLAGGVFHPVIKPTVSKLLFEDMNHLIQVVEVFVKTSDMAAFSIRIAKSPQVIFKNWLVEEYFRRDGQALSRKNKW